MTGSEVGRIWKGPLAGIRTRDACSVNDAICWRAAHKATGADYRLNILCQYLLLM